MAAENTIPEILNNYFVIATLLMPAVIMITLRRWVSPINFNFFQDVYKFVGYGIFNFIVFCGIVKTLKWDLINDVFTLSNVLIEPLHYIWFVVFLPILLGILLALIDRWHIMHYILKPIFHKNIETNGLTAWEEFFSQNLSGKINVVLNNGTQIIGYFDFDSMVSSSVDVLWINTHTDTSIQRVDSYLSKYSNYELVKSNIIADKIPQKIKKICVANIDVDMYEAVKAALYKVKDKIVQNGIVICEDYGHTPALIGAQKAVQEFLSENPNEFISIYLNSGQMFLIKM